MPSIRSLPWTLLPLALLLGCPSGADDDDSVGDDDDSVGDDDDSVGDDDDATGDDDDATGDDDDATGDDDDATGDDDDSTPPPDPATGWWLTQVDGAEVSNTCGVTTVPMPSFEIAFDGTDWTAWSPAFSASNVIPLTELSYDCVLGNEFVCTTSGLVGAFPTTLTLSSDDWWEATPTWELTASVTLGAGQSCSIVSTGTFVPWTPPEVSACTTGAVTPSSSVSEGVVRPVVRGQYGTPADALYFSDSAPADVDVAYPSGTLATGTAPSGGGQLNTWSSLIDLGERQVLRVVTDSGDQSQRYPTNMTLIADQANYYVWPRTYLRGFWAQAALAGGFGPSLPDFGKLEVEATRQDNGQPLDGAVVTVTGGHEGAYTLANQGGRYMQAVPSPGAVTPIGAPLYFTNVCPGMVHVSVVNSSGVDCIVGPEGTANGAAGVDVAVVADEWSMVQFRCPVP